jgi:hypothetical protein
LPPTRLFGGTSRVTTEPAATTAYSPIVTPPMTGRASSAFRSSPCWAA